MNKTILLAITSLSIVGVAVQPVMATHIYHWDQTMENFEVRESAISTSAIAISWDELVHPSKHTPTELKYYKIVVHRADPFMRIFAENTHQTQITVETHQNNTNFNIYAWPVFTDSLMGKRHLVNFNTTGT